MTATDTRLRTRLAYLIHQGCVELRNLAYDRAPHEQIADLSDALEILPRYFDREDGPTEEDWEMVRSIAGGYASRYPDSGAYLTRCLDADPPRWHS